MDVNNINILVLAYLGDTIYENYVRRYLINKGIGNVNDLQRESIQAAYLLELIESNFFTEEEIDVIKRARNYKNNSHPKNCDVVTYKYATGLEALIGYLDFVGNVGRIDEIMKIILK